ncbi:fimbria/pilus periplasmic chaperone [Vibrio sp.]|nr:fimbria/pilus periplasmic chaperone [Vibrio sp.]
MKRFILYLVFCLSFLSMGSYAFQLQPMIQTMAPSGVASSSVYRVDNTSDFPLPIEVNVLSRTVDEQGNEVLTESDDFLILPAQTIIAPNRTQAFRVKYLGQQDIDSSTSYRIVFDQLPVSDSRDSSGVDTVFSFGTLVFVEPKNSQVRLEVANSEQSIELLNSGNKVLELNNTQFVVESDNGDIQEVPWGFFSPVAKYNYLMPNQKQVIPFSEVFPQPNRIKSVRVK